ncbi:MAG TPA: HAMP domain-containing histidine kinase [Chloroflexi bacterium]|nr:HAMP domain-containing histidine kinase [Chloroflexota bacterium]
MPEIIRDPKEDPVPGRGVWLKQWVGSLATSRLADWVMNLPPVAWLVRTLTRSLVKRRSGDVPARDALVERGAEIGLEATLHQIVYDVVTALGYAGAMVATYEQGDSLPVRALYVDPALATAEQIRRWEDEISQYTARPVSITDPAIARVYVYQAECQANLSVRAFKADGLVISDDLYDLFTPVAPLATRPVVKGIQEALGIQQVVAVPFFLETAIDGRTEREMVGNLFAAKRGPISERDELVLSAFGRQAAAAIESERRRLQIEVAQEIVFEVQHGLQDEGQIIQRIAEGVVSDLGYAGAMVATYEPDDSLPVRAFYVDPHLATEAQIHQWETDISRYTPSPVSITDPEVARVFVYLSEYKDNLSVRAFRAGGIVVSDELYDLFAPVAPPAARPVVRGIQQALGIQQVIAVPFFLETFTGAQLTREIVGNLFAATRSKRFSGGEVALLKAFSQQAAAGIRNARLYHQVEERRQVAQVFGKMAFSAAASVHALRNHIGAFQIHLDLIRTLPPEQRDQILAVSDKIMERLDEATEILDNLHEPWRATLEVLTDVNACIRKAMGRVIRDEEEIKVREGIVVHAVLPEGLPAVKTAPDMLIEAFRVLIRNALEAIREKGSGGELEIESRLGERPVVEVTISDTGVGIQPRDMSRVFELRWSTKEGAGMGFGLFWTKEYIQGLGGCIRVESIWQGGTTFYVTLPVSLEPLPD